jgi:hypothetical protein
MHISGNEFFLNVIDRVVSVLNNSSIITTDVKHLKYKYQFKWGVLIVYNAAGQVPHNSFRTRMNAAVAYIRIWVCVCVCVSKGRLNSLERRYLQAIS